MSPLSTGARPHVYFPTEQDSGQERFTVTANNLYRNISYRDNVRIWH